ncbi:hypothetical protein KPC_0599 [Acinetobacter stercoris]|uniref:Uncharacterized protein n=1 Tax=Acinetobacter stercoris TaxID=2126983 RepID=A0A2U3MVG7_9GAMM|nr:hypothetical protein KPC_0599 [Acinetobacter stercoris]
MEVDSILILILFVQAVEIVDLISCHSWLEQELEAACAN